MTPSFAAPLPENRAASVRAAAAPGGPLPHT